MLLFKVTKIYFFKRTGNNVGDGALVLKDESPFEYAEFDPVHVRDLAILTKIFQNERTIDLTCSLALLVSDNVSCMEK